MLKENSKAPDFSLEGSDGKKYSLKDFKGKYLILYFYPRDNTPGCTMEAREYNKRIGEIRKLGAEVVGISNDGIDSHCKFSEKLELGFTLLSDKESKVIKAYDSYGDRGIFGMGTIRNTFVIDKGGKITKVYTKVSPSAHVQEVIDLIKERSKK